MQICRARQLATGENPTKLLLRNIATRFPMLWPLLPSFLNHSSRLYPDLLASPRSLVITAGSFTCSFLCLGHHPALHMAGWLLLIIALSPEMLSLSTPSNPASARPCLHLSSPFDSPHSLSHSPKLLCFFTYPNERVSIMRTGNCSCRVLCGQALAYRRASVNIY